MAVSHYGFSKVESDILLASWAPKIPTESGREVKEQYTYFDPNTGNNKQVKC